MKFKLNLHLPFRLPIKDGQKFVSGYEYAEFISIYKTYVRTTVIGDFEEPFNQQCTVVNITYLPKEQTIQSLDKDELLRQSVLDSLHYVNQVIDVIRSEFGLEYLTNITIADLPLMLIIETEQGDFGYITRPQDITRSETIISKEGMVRIGKALATWDKHPEIYLVHKYFAAAKSHLYKEQFVDAVIDLQTSFEIFVRNVHKMILLKNGVDETRIEKAATIPFRNVIEHHLAKYLKTNLNFDNPGVINDWYEKLYKVRNDIVHKGRTQLSGNESYEAYDAYVDARNFLCDRLNEEGYMIDGKVDLSLFQKNTKGHIDGEEMIKRLKEKGLIEEHLEYKKI